MQTQSPQPKRVRITRYLFHARCLPQCSIHISDRDKVTLEVGVTGTCYMCGKAVRTWDKAASIHKEF